MIRAVLLSLLMACTLGMQRADAARYELAFRFVAAVEGHDVAALRSLGAMPMSVSLRDVLDRFDCITIDRWSVEAPAYDPSVMRIRIAGSGVAVNARHDVKAIPASWIVKLDGNRIVAAMREEHFIAQRIIAARDDPARDAIVAAHRELPLRDVLHAAIDELEATRVTQDFARSDALAWVIATAGAHEEWGVEARAAAETPRDDSAADSARRTEVALRMARRTNDCDVIATALFRAANAEYAAGHDEGLDRLLDVAAMADSLDDGRIALKALHNFASDMAWTRGDLRRGFAAAERFEAKSQQFGWREGKTIARMTMADVDEIIGDDEAALALRRNAVAELDAIGNAEWATWIAAAVAQAEMHLGRRTRALRDMHAAVSRANGDFANRVVLIDTLAQMEIDAGHVTGAARLLRGQPRTNHIVCAQLDFAEHRYAEAVRDARIAEDCGGSEDSCWKGMRLAARALLRLGRRDEAVASLEAAIDEIEKRRAHIDASELGRSRYFELRLEPYRDLLDLYLRSGRTRDALRIAETVKARAVLDTLSLGRAGLGDALTPEEEARRRRLEAHLEQLNRDILAVRAEAQRHSIDRDRAGARREIEAFEQEMALRHPIGRGVRASELPENLAAIVTSRDVAAIEYAVLPRSVIAFIVVRGRHGDVAIHAKRIAVTADEITRRAGALRTAIGARSLAADAQLARFDALLLAPLRPWITGKKLIYVVPDGALWQVPFQALASSAGTPLVAHSAVAYAPSFAALTAAGRHRSAQPRALLAMGDAAIGSDETAAVRAFNRDFILGRLPDAAEEVRAIAAEYGAQQSDVYVREAATETTLKASAGGHRIIHLATHGIADSRWPMFSALVLTPTAQDDGLLEAREVAAMHLDADLVVLSGCDTARGLIRSGEGVIGLSWAFLLAGCPRTVVSQWSADSKATAALMIEFHRQLVRGATPAGALRAAQMSLMRNSRYAHPYYWANFIVLGSP